MVYKVLLGVALVVGGLTTWQGYRAGKAQANATNILNNRASQDRATRSNHNAIQKSFFSDMPSVQHELDGLFPTLPPPADDQSIQCESACRTLCAYPV